MRHKTLQDLHITASDPKDILLQSIEKGKLRYTDTLKLSLPPLIARSEDVWGFEWPNAKFYYTKQVTAPVIGYEMRDKLENSIICIPSADPGTTGCLPINCRSDYCVGCKFTYGD